MPPGFPPGGFSYIYIFLLCLVGRRGVLTVERRARWNFGRDFAVERRFDGGAVLVAARGAWRGRATRWRVGGYGWCGSAELLRYTGERGIMGGGGAP